MDDFFHHFEVFNKYNLIVSGCGLTRADIVGSIISKVENDQDLVLITPVFTSNTEQQLRIHYPKSRTPQLLHFLGKIPLFENLQPREFSESMHCIDLFTCFFSSIELPSSTEDYQPISEGMNLGKINVGSPEGKTLPQNFKKLNLGELTKLLDQK